MESTRNAINEWFENMTTNFDSLNFDNFKEFTDSAFNFSQFSHFTEGTTLAADELLDLQRQGKINIEPKHHIFIIPGITSTRMIKFFIDSDSIINSVNVLLCFI